MAQMYSVASAVDDTLRQQREEERRAMLDALNQKDLESQMAARDETTKINALNRKVATGKIFLDQFGMGQETSPEDYAQAKDLGVGGAFSKPLEGMGSDFEGPMMTGETPAQAQKGSPSRFLGSAEEQAKARDDAALNNLLNKSYFEDPDVSPIEKAMLAKRLADLTLPSEYYKPKQEPGQFLAYDPVTNSLVKPKGAEAYVGENKIVTRERPPQGPKGPEPRFIDWTGPDGKQHYGYASPATNKVVEITGIDAVNPKMIGGSGSGGSGGADGAGGGVPVGLSTAYAQALGELAKASDGRGRTEATRRDASARAATLRQAIINNGITPKAKELIRNALVAAEKDPRTAGWTTPDLLASSLDDSYTPAEKANIIGTLSQVRGR